MGQEIIAALERLGEDYIAVDNNPEIIKRLIKKKVPCMYGDAASIETIEKANVEQAKLVVSTIPEEEENLLIIEATKQLNPDALVYVTAKDLDRSIYFYRQGADYVILPRMLSGLLVTKNLGELFRKGEKWMEKNKLDHIKYLEGKKREDFLEDFEEKYVGKVEEAKKKPKWCYVEDLEILEKMEEPEEEREKPKKPKKKKKPKSKKAKKSPKK
jgi:hypothetical protein